MTTLKKYKRILDNQIRLDAYMALEMVIEKASMKPFLENSVFQQSLYYAVRNGLLEATDEMTPTYTATTKGLKAYNNINESPDSEEVKPVLKAKPVAQNDIMVLHEALKNKLYSLIKKKQIVGFGNVPFIPSLTDLQEFLERFRKKYPDLYDLEKITVCLSKHIEKCAKSDKYSPAVKYFIIKEGSGSQLAALLEVFDETPADEEQHNITKTKDLFDE